LVLGLPPSFFDFFPFFCLDDWLVFAMMGSISVFQFIFVSVGFPFATVFLVALGF
jgi:hypothetical protein